MSDHLIASNGLIHPRLVGEMRYLDSRDDEQVHVRREQMHAIMCTCHETSLQILAMDLEVILSHNDTSIKMILRQACMDFKHQIGILRGS